MEPESSGIDPVTRPSARWRENSGEAGRGPRQEDGGHPPVDAGAGDGALPGPLDTGGWSRGSRTAIAGAIAVVSVATALHLAMVFLHIAPSNTVSKQNNRVIDDYVFPEFEQNWKLFAPNPLQQNIAVHARARVERAGGEQTTTGWVDLTRQDGDAIRHNPAPSHVNQNLLRRAWDFYTGSHDEKDKPLGDRGALSEEYVRRIVAHRLGPRLNGGRVVKVQVRAATTAVAPPKWSREVIDTATSYRVVPWWTVTEEDFR